MTFPAVEIELRHLRLIAAVADAGSISAAAAALGTTQPAASRQLARLEAAAGGALFERTSRGVVPTALGATVLARARAVLPVLDPLLGTADGSGSAHVRRVLLASPIARTLVAMVAAGQVDAVVLPENVGYELAPSPAVTRYVLGVEPVFVMLGVDHPLARRTEVELTELAEDRWVLEPDDGDGTSDYVTRTCARAGFAIRVAHHLSDDRAIEVLQHEHDVGLTHALARPREDLAIVPLAGAPLRCRQVMLVHRHRPFAAHAEQVAARTRAELARLARAHPVLGPYLERNGPVTWDSRDVP